MHFPAHFCNFTARSVVFQHRYAVFQHIYAVFQPSFHAQICRIPPRSVVSLFICSCNTSAISIYQGVRSATLKFCIAEQMSPNVNDCSWDSSMESVSRGDKESKLSSTELVVSAQTCSDKSTSVHVCSANKWNGYVYKRRKLHRNSLDLLPEGNSTAIPKGISGLDSQKSTNRRSQIELVPNSTCNSICSVREHEEPEQLFTGDFFKYTYECYLRVYGASSLSKPNVGHGSTSTKIAVGDSGECSPFDDVAVEPLTTFTSVKEQCIFVLKSHGLLGGDWTSTNSGSLEVIDDTDKLSQSCKICGLSELPIKMLICDLCEEAFHVSCCKSKVKVLLLHKWHCPPCSKKKQKTLWLKHTGKSFENIKSRKRTWHVESHVSLMLKDVLPFTSKVRIGKEFQAEIPEWCSPIHEKCRDTLFV